MFFVLPWKLRQAGDGKAVPVVNFALIAVNVLFYLLGGCCVVGPGTGVLSLGLYAFSHVSLWHLLFNMWALWVFGNPVNRRLGNGFYLAAYLGSAIVLGIFARLMLTTALAGASGVVFAVIAIAMLLMPAAVLETVCVAVFPLSIIVGLLSRPLDWFRWLVRWTVYPVPALWALVLIPLMQLALFYWYSWSPTYLAHLLGMLCGVAIVLLLPMRITMGRRSALNI